MNKVRLRIVTSLIYSLSNRTVSAFYSQNIIASDRILWILDIAKICIIFNRVKENKEVDRMKKIHLFNYNR